MSQTTTDGYRTVRIRNAIVEKIEARLAKDKTFGSISDIVEYSVREFLGGHIK